MVPWEISPDQVDVEIVADIRRKDHLWQPELASHQGSAWHDGMVVVPRMERNGQMAALVQDEKELNVLPDKN